MSDRTLLYGLPLKGVETPNVEGLRSYFQRLAFLHHLAPHALMDVIRTKFPFQSHYGALMGTFPSREIHGQSLLVRELLDRVEFATGTELASSTMMRFSPILSSTHLLHRKPGRYCPICVRAASNPEDIPAHLAWEIQCVECCSVHGVLLAVPSECGAPSAQQCRPSRRPQLPCVCGSCGSIGRLCSGAGVVAASQSQVWVAENVGRLLAMTMKRALTLSSSSVRAGLNELLKTRYRGSVVNASLDCGFSRSTVWAWVRGESKPPLAMLAALCFHAKADIASVLDGRYVHMPRPDGALHYAKRQYVRARCDWETVRTALILAAEREAPPSKKELANALGVCARSLRDRFPVEAEKLAIARRDYVDHCRLQRLREFEATLVVAAEAMIAEGRAVTDKRLVIHGGISIFRHDWRRPVVEKVLALYAKKAAPLPCPASRSDLPGSSRSRGPVSPTY